MACRPEWLHGPCNEIRMSDIALSFWTTRANDVPCDLLVVAGHGPYYHTDKSLCLHWS